MQVFRVKNPLTAKESVLPRSHSSLFLPPSQKASWASPGLCGHGASCFQAALGSLTRRLVDVFPPSLMALRLLARILKPLLVGSGCCHKNTINQVV